MSYSYEFQAIPYARNILKLYRLLSYIAFQKDMQLQNFYKLSTMDQLYYFLFVILTFRVAPAKFLLNGSKELLKKFLKTSTFKISVRFQLDSSNKVG